MRKLSTVIAGALALCATEASAVGIVGPDEVVEGKTIGEWSAEWWKWVGTQTPDNNALIGRGNPSVNQPFQSENVWFLGGTFGTEEERKIHVPPDSYVLFPILNCLSTRGGGDGETESELKDAVSDCLSSATDLFAEIDGEPITDIDGSPIENLDEARLEEPFFFETIDFVTDNILGLPAGDNGPATSDGWYVMLEPFGEKVTKTISFGGALPAFGDFAVRVDAIVTSVPLPATLSLLGLGLAGLALTRRRKTVT